MFKYIIIFFIALLFGNTVFAKPLFYTSIPPVKFLIDQISGGEIETRTIIKSGSYPHLYSPTPKDIISLSKATSYFSLDAPFEKGILNKIKTILPTFNIVDCSKGSLKRKQNGNHTHVHSTDPHIWNDPDNLISISYNIFKEVIRLFPNNNLYKNNFNTLQKRLRELKKRVAENLSRVTNRTILVYHPSLGHFCNTFKINMITVESDGKFPSPKRLLKLSKMAKESSVKSLILWPSASKKNSNTLAKALSVNIIFFDPIAYDVYNNLLKLSKMIRGNIDNNKQ